MRDHATVGTRSEPVAARSRAAASAVRVTPRASAVLALQRSAGNRATVRALQRCGGGKCTCGGKCGGGKAPEEELDLLRHH